MNLWKSFKNYVSEIEKSIDADFQEKENENSSIQNGEERDNDKVLEQAMNEENQLGEGKMNSKEEEEDVNEAEKIEELKSKIEQCELELEENNQKFEEYQKVIYDIGPNGKMLVSEFNERIC